jgi:hypothetical protein
MMDFRLFCWFFENFLSWFFKKSAKNLEEICQKFCRILAEIYFLPKVRTSSQSNLNSPHPHPQTINLLKTTQTPSISITKRVQV